MKRTVKPHHILLAGLAVLLAILPAVQPATGQGGLPGGFFFPFMFKDGGDGGTPPTQQPGATPTPTATSPAGPGQGSGQTGSLENGGTFEGPGGARLGALAGSLEAPIEVTIAVTGAPTISLPAPAQRLGDYFHISGGEKVYTSPEEPLILALPIPLGAATDHLALALLPFEEEMDDVPAGAAAWIYQEGKVDSSRNLFLTTLENLSQAGHSLALVEHPDFDSPPHDAPSAAGTGMARAASANFRAMCVNFTNPGECTPTTESEVAIFMSQVYTRIQDELGFNRPRLRYLSETLHYDPNSLTSTGYVVYIEPYTVPGFCDPVKVAGYYQAARGRLVLCLDPSQGFNEAARKILVHEYFHATQYGYLATFADYADNSREKWVIEGMASATMESYNLDEMRRVDFYGDLHLADLSLKTSGDPVLLHEYLAQDFWVYYGQNNGLGLSYLEQVLSLGATSKTVAESLGDGTHLEAYWRWTKNHVMEPEVDYEGLLNTPCELELAVVSQPQEAYFGVTSGTSDFMVAPLESVVVDIRWDWDGYIFAEGIAFPTPLTSQDYTEANQALRYKFYEEGEDYCESVPDRGRRYDHPDPTRRYYLVISNIHHEKSFTYRVIFEAFPSPP